MNRLKLTRNGVLTLVVAFFATNGFAQSESQMESRYSAGNIVKGWSPAVSLSYGYLYQNGIADDDGEGVGLQLVGTNKIEDTFWLIDAGVGFHQQYLPDYSSDQFMGLVSLDARYEFQPLWSVGPAAIAYIGNGEAFGRSNNFVPMMGLVGFKEFNTGDQSAMRLGLKYTYEVGNADQTTTFAGIVFEWAAKQPRYVADAQEVRLGMSER